MKHAAAIAILMLTAAVSSAQEGRRIEAGPSFLEPLQERDSVLVFDQFRYGIQLKDIEEGTPLALPLINDETRKKTAEEGHLVILGDWQLDSTLVSSRRDSTARYDIRAYMTVTPSVPGQFELFPLECIVGADTLVFIRQMIQVTEPSIDLETFQPNDIKPQEKFPYTFRELAPWIFGAMAILGLIVLLIAWLYNRRKAIKEAEEAEPAHIKALRKLEKLRDQKYWKPEHQKEFYSGVTDTLREYMASRYGIGAKEMTTAEIFASLGDLPADLYNTTKDLFERADFVKFAKYTASDEDNAAAVPDAVNFVSATFQEAPAKEEEEALSKQKINYFEDED